MSDGRTETENRSTLIKSKATLLPPCLPGLAHCILTEFFFKMIHFNLYVFVKTMCLQNLASCILTEFFKILISTFQDIILNYFSVKIRLCAMAMLLQ